MIEKIAQWLGNRANLGSWESLNTEDKEYHYEDAQAIAQIVKTELEGSLLESWEITEAHKRSVSYVAEAQLAKTLGRIGV